VFWVPVGLDAAKPTQEDFFILPYRHTGWGSTGLSPADSKSDQNQTFTSDMALLKLVYLATKNIEKKWTSPLQNWSLTVQQLAIRFGESLPLAINQRPERE
jgi:hypothetical protein